MGKPKKDKRNRQDENFGDDDIDLDPLANLNSDEVPNIQAAKQSKKDKRKNKQKDDDGDDDVVSKMQSLALDEEINGETQSAKPNKDKKSKKNIKTKAESDDEDSEVDLDSIAYAEPVHSYKKAVGGFGMLAALEDENDMLQSDDDEDEVDDSKPKPAQKENKKQTTEDTESAPAENKSKNKKKNKKIKKEDEDLDALIAALDEPKEKTSKKAKKKKKQEEAEAELEENQNDEAELLEGEKETVAPVELKVVTMEDLEEEEDTRKKKKKPKKKDKTEGADGDDNDGDVDEGGGTVKTAAQKKKEKKEREKKKRELQKQQENKKSEITPAEVKEEIKSQEKTEEETSEKTEEKSALEEDQDEGEKDLEGEDGEGKSKKKKKKGKEEKETKKKGPSKQIAALKEHLKKVQEEEERQRLAEEEKQRKLEEAIQHREEQKRLEEERKLRKKQKEKEKTERLKAEGKFLTAKQKQDKKRAMQMLELMKAQGLEIPAKDEVPKKRPVYAKKKKASQRQDSQEESEKSPSPVEEVVKESSPESEAVEEVAKEVAKEVDTITKGVEEDVKDSWDISDEEVETDNIETKHTKEKTTTVKEEVKRQKSEDGEEEEEDSEGSELEEESEEEGSSEEESSEESSQDDEDLDGVERARIKIEKRRQMAESKRNTDVLRAPVVCVLGHVDTGKTKILDKLRRTNVQDGEAGGITQQIGATNVPQHAIREKTSMCKDFQKSELKLPGLLIIDTPGHESFSNLRSRGSSLCDIAILVVDIMHGLEPQTIESINLLKSRKTPFIVALNKIDRLYQWKPNPNSDVVNTLKKQHQNTRLEFDERTREVVLQFAEQGLNAALFSENQNTREYVSMVPTSAHSGDGMGNLVALICQLSQDLLAKRVSYSEELQATVMEVKAIHGLGTTIDVILVNGKIGEGQTIVTAGTDGPIVTQIRGLLMPQPMKELRVKNQYEKHKEVLAAQGVKIIAKDLEKALAGLPLYVAHDSDEVEYYKEEVTRAFKAVLSSIKLAERGVFVQASTLGSLEALLEFLRTSKIPYAGIGIGPVHRKDIMKASIMLEHDIQYAVILAFDVKIEREAQELAESLSVKVFSADIIYHLFDKFMAYRDELKKQRQDEFKHLAVFPTKLRILPQYIFNTRDPIVLGVVVEAGFVKEGTPLCVPSKEFVEIGIVSSVEFNHKPIETARKGQEVCIKIQPTPGEAPKLYGRHFDYSDILVSKISRQSIDTVKEYFRDEMTKPDWQLIVELKKMFQII